MRSYTVCLPFLKPGLVHNVLLPLLCGLGILALIVKNGRHLVNKPQLCPALAQTVLPPPKLKSR